MMQLMDEESRKSYPAIFILVTQGKFIALFVGVLIPIASLWAWLSGGPAYMIAIGFIGGLIVYLLLRSYVEMAQIMADMLLPK